MFGVGWLVVYALACVGVLQIVLLDWWIFKFWFWWLRWWICWFVVYCLLVCCIDLLDLFWFFLLVVCCLMCWLGWYFGFYLMFEFGFWVFWCFVDIWFFNTFISLRTLVFLCFRWLSFVVKLDWIGLIWFRCFYFGLFNLDFDCFGYYLIVFVLQFGYDWLVLIMILF